MSISYSSRSRSIGPRRSLSGLRISKLRQTRRTHTVPATQDAREVQPEVDVDTAECEPPEAVALLRAEALLLGIDGRRRNLAGALGVGVNDLQSTAGARRYDPRDELDALQECCRALSDYLQIARGQIGSGDSRTDAGSVAAEQYIESPPCERQVAEREDLETREDQTAAPATEQRGVVHCSCTTHGFVTRRP